MSGRIVRLTVSNLLRLRAVEVTPDGPLVVVGGANDQGKSSVLNTIALALSGRDVPIQPIRQGAASGTVILQTNELTVTRRFSQTGGSSLEVRDKEGVKLTSPQAKLDALVSRITFDPFQFTREDPATQASTVRRIAGLDFTELDAEHRAKFLSRTEVNRSVRASEGKLQAIGRAPDAPSEEVLASDIADELDAAHATNRANAERRADLARLESIEDLASKEILEAERELTAARKAFQTAGDRLDQSHDARENALAAVTNQKEVCEALEDVNPDPFRARIRDAELTNQKVRQNREWNNEHRAMTALQEESQALTRRLEAIEVEKSEALSEAKFPVDGLGFDETGVTYKGVPFAQAGTAVKIRVSVAIARSLNPALPVMLVRDGSLLDCESMRLLQKEAEDTGCQIWVEVVGDREDATVIIEDGAVIATPAATRKQQTKKVPTSNV